MILAALKKVVIVGVSPRLAEAEKVLHHLNSYQQNDFQTSLHVLKRVPDYDCYLKPDSYGYGRVLFGSADIMHTHLFLPGLLVAIRKIWNPSLRWIHTVHYSDYTGQKFAKLKKILDEKFIFPRVDKLIFVSEAAKQSFKKFDAASVISNAVEFLKPSPAAKRMFNASAPVLGCVAMFQEEKGLLDLLNIFSDFVKLYPGAKLRIAGDGPQRSLLEKRRFELKLQNSVTFCGFQKNIQRFYESIDIYVQPSISESFCVTVLEVMPFAKPIVATRVGNLSHLLQNDEGLFGILVERDKDFAKNLIASLQAACTDYRQYSEAALAGFEYWNQFLSQAVMQKKYFDIYKDLLRPGVCMIATHITPAQSELQQQVHLQSLELNKKGFKVYILQNQDQQLFLQMQKWGHVEFLMVPQPFANFFKDSSFIKKIRKTLFLICGMWHLARQNKKIQIYHVREHGAPSSLGTLAEKIFSKPLVGPDVVPEVLEDLYKELLFNKKIKIIRIFSQLNIGGPAIHVVNLTFGLEKYHYETKLLVGQTSSGEGNMSYYAFKNHVEPIVIPELQVPFHLVKDFKAFLKIIKILWIEKPDIVHTHTRKAGLLGRLAAFTLRVPYRVHSYHGHLLDMTWVEKILNHTTHSLIAVSELVSKDLVYRGIVPAKKMNVIELGFDLDNFLVEANIPSTLRSSLGLTEQNILVGIAERLTPEKTVDLFLNSIGPLLRKYPLLHVAVIGDGPERQRLEKLALPYGHRVHFMGWLSPLHPELKDLDLLVCSSKSEGTSVSVIEAILCKVPVISTRVGGMADLLRNGQYGDLVEHNWVHLTQALDKKIKILSDKNSLSYRNLKTQGEISQQAFYKRFHIRRLLTDMHQLYSKKLRPHQPELSEKFSDTQSQPLSPIPMNSLTNPAAQKFKAQNLHDHLDAK